jgi:hypothetical protein
VFDVEKSVVVLNDVGSVVEVDPLSVLVPTTVVPGR